MRSMDEQVSVKRYLIASNRFWSKQVIRCWKEMQIPHTLLHQMAIYI